MNSPLVLDPLQLPPEESWRVGFWDRLKVRLRRYRDDLLIAGLILLALIIFTLPLIIHTIPAGHVGVRWKRFLGGTEEGMPESEGTIFTWPWDKVAIYDLRLRQVERQIEVLSSDGLSISVDLVWRYRLVRGSVGRLHKYVGPKYEEDLLNPTVTARARDVLSVYRPDEIYTERRLVIQSTIARTVREELRNNFNPDPDPDSPQARIDKADLKHEVEALKRIDPDAASSLVQAAERAIEEQRRIELQCSKLDPGYRKDKCLNSIPWFVLEDVLIKGITLPKGVQEAIVRKAVASHEVEEFVFKIAREEKEAERKRIEALSIRNFQEIISNTMSDTYLRWRGIEATLALANSPNAKVVVIGNGKNGLPLILNTEEGGHGLRGTHAAGNQNNNSTVAAHSSTATIPASTTSSTSSTATTPATATTTTPSNATTATTAATAAAPVVAAAQPRRHGHSAVIPQSTSQDRAVLRDSVGQHDRAPAKPRQHTEAAEPDQSWWQRLRAVWQTGG
ncbi:prohibitin family protein [Chitinimonas lacunae]|uniref:Prohibitin family protein n=1 Tax=Chitinimonas lacunae TaxID=1963018 RepID=A0ABV8MPV6_9NEIS